jgi:signal transduction histidine kinase
MDQILDYVLTLFSQTGGGPGPKENNLVRFGVPAVLWAVLLIVAWSRQRRQALPREQLLVWGFALGFTRELFMFTHVSAQLLELNVPGLTVRLAGFFTAEPLEHALTLAAIVVVAGAYQRYILRDVALSRRYLQVGLVIALITYLGVSWWWAQHSAAHPETRFNQALGGLVFHLATSALTLTALVILARARGWLRNIVALALFFFFLGSFLKVLNFPTDRAYAYVLCPFANNLHILAIPVLGYVYLREQSIEKQQAQNDLRAYKDHLEELVEERTGALTQTNEQLQQEIAERTRAEQEIAQRNVELAAQNAIAATVSQSLDLDTILNTALDTVLAVLEMEAGCIYLLEPDGETLVPQTRRGRRTADAKEPLSLPPCSCKGISRRAVLEMKPVVLNVADFPGECRSAFVQGEQLQTLVGTPLVAKGRAVGALSLGSKRPGAVHPDTLDLLSGIGQQIGVVVENAHLYQETEDWAKELALLHQVSVFLSSTLDPGEIYDHIAEQSAKILGCQVACVFRWDREHEQLVGVSNYGAYAPAVDGLRFKVDESPILREIIANRRSIAIDDVMADLRIPPLWEERFHMQALLGVPVWGADMPLALLFLVEQQGPRRWRQDEIDLVESFVNGAAVALENAYLHKQLEWAAALEERQRIAAEMHDGLAQVLSYLGHRVDAATELAETDSVPEMVDLWQEVRDVVDRASREARRSIASLQQSPRPRQSLQQSLAGLIAEAVETDGPSAELLDEVSTPLFVTQEQTIQVLRVVQEGLLNARRHARAERIRVRLQRQDGQLRIVVEDDGQGFDPGLPPVDSADHFGLSIIRARAARIGGQVEVDSAPGRGTRVRLTWKPAGTGPLVEPDQIRRPPDR